MMASILLILTAFSIASGEFNKFDCDQKPTSSSVLDQCSVDYMVYEYCRKLWEVDQEVKLIKSELFLMVF